MFLVFRVTLAESPDDCRVSRASHRCSLYQSRAGSNHNASACISIEKRIVALLRPLCACPTGDMQMAILMQAFYWDAPQHENQEGNWWNVIASKVPELANAGINALWLPPISKCSINTSMGYDPYDYYDLGDFDQKGSIKTLFGNRAELENLIKVARDNHVGCYADMVINHNSGADEEETNPLDGQRRWTKFNPKSGRFPRDWNCFHPSRYEQVMIEGENFGGFPHLCHRNPLVYTEMFNYARLLIEELGFDGFRFDFAKGFGAWMIGVLAKYRYVKDGAEFTPYVVGELWSGTEDIDAWLG